MTLAAALVLAGTCLAAVFLVPQIRRVFVTRDTSGVSPAWAAFGVVTNSAWILYLVGQRLWAPAFAPALAFVTYGSLLAVMGVEGFAVALVLTPAVQIIPEVGAKFRDASLRGVSPGTWWLGLAEAICWGWFGLIVGDGALVGYGAVMSFGPAVILIRWWTVCGNRQVRMA